MNIHKIVLDTIAEGPGHRDAIWVQGCSIHCKGCFEKETWSTDCGKEICVPDLIEFLLNEKTEGVTILGGEPFDQAAALAELIFTLKRNGKNIICFTGYKYEDLSKKIDDGIEKMLNHIDLLVDGPFIEQLNVTDFPLIGSANQRFIALSTEGNELLKRLKVYKNSVEVRVMPNGVILVNGMWKRGN